MENNSQNNQVQTTAQVSEVQQAASQPVQQQVVYVEKKGMSDDTKTILTVILLLLAYPIGAILVWFWVKWPKWVKILVTLPFLLFVLAFIAIFAIAMLAAVNPSAQIKRAEYMTECTKTKTSEECSQMFLEKESGAGQKVNTDSLEEQNK